MASWADARRRKEELYFVQQHEAPPALPRDQCWFLIDAKWMERWWAYVTTADGAVPGPITNEVLVEEAWQLRLHGDAPGNADKPRSGLLLTTDYACVTSVVWCFLVEMHGSSQLPPLARYTKDIYGVHVPSVSLEKMLKGPRLQAKVLASSFFQHASGQISPRPPGQEATVPTYAADTFWRALGMVPLEYWTQLQFCIVLLSDIAFRATFGSLPWQGAALGAIWISVPTLLVHFAVSTVGQLCVKATAVGAHQVVGVWLQAALAFAVVAAAPVIVWFAYLQETLSWVVQDQAMLATAQDFASTLSFGLVPHFAFTALASVAASQGATKPVVVAHLSTWLVNAALNVVCVRGWLSFPVLGVAGPAWATVASQFIQWMAFTVWIFFVSRSLDENWGGWTSEGFRRLPRFAVSALSPASVWTSAAHWVVMAIVVCVAAICLPISRAATQTVFLFVFHCGRLCSQAIVDATVKTRFKNRAAATVVLVAGMGALSAGVGVGGATFVRFFLGAEAESALQALQPALLATLGLVTCTSAMQVWLLESADDSFFHQYGNVVATAVVYVPLTFVMGVKWQWGLGGMWWAAACTELWVALVLCWATVRGKASSRESEEERALLSTTTKTPPSEERQLFGDGKDVRAGAGEGKEATSEGTAPVNEVLGQWIVDARLQIDALELDASSPACLAWLGCYHRHGGMAVEGARGDGGRGKQTLTAQDQGNGWSWCVASSICGGRRPVRRYDNALDGSLQETSGALSHADDAWNVRTDPDAATGCSGPSQPNKASHHDDRERGDGHPAGHLQFDQDADDISCCGCWRNTSSSRSSWPQGSGDSDRRSSSGMCGILCCGRSGDRTHHNPHDGADHAKADMANLYRKDLQGVVSTSQSNGYHENEDAAVRCDVDRGAGTPKNRQNGGRVSSTSASLKRPNELANKGDRGHCLYGAFSCFPCLRSTAGHGDTERDSEALPSQCAHGVRDTSYGSAVSGRVDAASNVTKDNLLRSTQAPSALSTKKRGQKEMATPSCWTWLLGCCASRDRTNDESAPLLSPNTREDHELMDAAMDSPSSANPFKAPSSPPHVGTLATQEAYSTVMTDQVIHDDKTQPARSSKSASTAFAHSGNDDSGSVQSQAKNASNMGMTSSWVARNKDAHDADQLLSTDTRAGDESPRGGTQGYTSTSSCHPGNDLGPEPSTHSTPFDQGGSPSRLSSLISKSTAFVPPEADIPLTKHQVFASHQSSQSAKGGGRLSRMQFVESATSPANAFNLGERTHEVNMSPATASGSTPFYQPGLSPQETSRLLGRSSRELDLEASLVKFNGVDANDDELSIAAVNNLVDMETPIPDMELCLTKQGQLDVWREARVLLCMLPCLCFRFLVAQLALDTELIFVGHLGVPQLAGVGLVRFWVAIPFWFLYSSMRAVYVLGMQAKQRGNDRSAGLWLQTGLGFAFLGTVAVVYYYLHCPDLVGLAEFNDVTIAYAREYAPIILLGVFPSLSMAAMDNFMRVQGITLPAFVCATVACVLNITLHFVFIYGAFGWSGWGFVGSPWATVTSLVVQVVLYVAYTVGVKRYHARYWSEWTWASHRFGQYRLFWRVAAPLGGVVMVFCIAFCLIGAITSYAPSAATPSRLLLDDDVDAGSERAGAWVISFCLFLIVVAMFLGVAETTKTRMLVYLANGRPDLARHVLFVGLGYSVAFALAFASALLAYKNVVFRIWTNDMGVLAQCIDVVRWIMVCLVLASMRVVLAGGLIVLQKRPMVEVAAAVDIWCCQVPCSFVLPILLQFPGLNGFWIAVAVGECVHVLLLVYALCQSGGAANDRAVMKAVQAALLNQQSSSRALDDKEGAGDEDGPYAAIKPLLLPTAIIVKEGGASDQVVAANAKAMDDGPIDRVATAKTMDAADDVAIDFLAGSSSNDGHGSVGGVPEPLLVEESLERPHVLVHIQDTSTEITATPTPFTATHEQSGGGNGTPEKALHLVESASPPVLSSVSVEDDDCEAGFLQHGRRSEATASGSTIDLHGEMFSQALSAELSPDLFQPFSSDNASTAPESTEHAVHATPWTGNSSADSDDSSPRLLEQSSLKSGEGRLSIASLEIISVPTAHQPTNEMAASAESLPATSPSEETVHGAPSKRAALPNLTLVDSETPSPAPSDTENVSVLELTRAAPRQSPFATEELDTSATSVDQTTRNVKISTDPVEEQDENLTPEQPTHAKHDNDPPQHGASSSTTAAPLMQSDAASDEAQGAASRAIVVEAFAVVSQDRVARTPLPSPQGQCNAPSKDASPDMEPGIPLKNVHAATPNAATSPRPDTKSPLSSEAGYESSEEGAPSNHGTPSEASESESVASLTGKRWRRLNAPLPPSVQVETLGGVDITTLQFGKRSKKRRTREEKSRRVSTSPVRQRRPSAFGFQASLD